LAAGFDHDDWMDSLEWFPSLGSPAFVGLVGAVAAVLLLARRFARTPTARSWPLLIVRGTVLAVLLTLLLNPVRITENRLPPVAPEVVYLVDCSRSMALEKPFSRLQQIKQVIARSNDLMPGKTPAHTSLYRFGQDLLALKSTEQLDANDDATRLHEALAHLLSRFERLPKSVVVFSDGRTTEPGDAAAVVAAYRRLQVPVHVFPVGDLNTSADVAIQDVLAPRDAPPGSRVPVRVLTRSHGFAERRAEVRIRSLSNPHRPPLATLPISLKDGQQEHELIVTHDPAAGQLLVEVPPLEGEATEENNRVPFRIGARKGKIRVIYMEGTVSPPGEYRFIQDALQEDPNIECVCLEVNNQLADKPILFRVNDPSRGFPVTREELFTYDVVICSDIARTAFTQEQLDWTAELVAERGGGFVMIGGFTSFGSGRWKQTVWDGLVPIEMGGADGYYHNETFRVRIPPEMERHPVWRIVDDPIKNRQILAEMPQFYGTNQGDRLKPAATALGFCDRPISSSGIMPIFSCEPFGRGRSFAMLTDSTQGWGIDFERLWGEGDNRYFRKFWRNVIYWLVENSRQSNRRLRIDTDKILYRPGQPIKISAQAYDSKLEVTTGYRLLARLRATGRAGQTGPTTVIQEAALTPNQTEHVYQGEFLAPSLQRIPAPSGGEAAPHRTAALEVIALEGDRVAAQGVVDVQILDDPVEFHDPRPDPGCLEDLARLTNGKVLHSANELAQVLNSYSTAAGEVIVSRAPVWDHPGLWLLLVGLLAVEWIWRRWSGLA
jgi:uncharacterized membrane protein